MTPKCIQWTILTYLYVALWKKSFVQNGLKVIQLFQVMQMYSLQRRLKNTNISITSVHPGDVDTEIGRDYVDSKTWQLLLRFSRLIGELK